MFKTILFPTTGSRLSKKIAQSIVDLIVQRPERKVIILNVVNYYDLPAQIEYEMERSGLSYEEITKRNIEESLEKSIDVFKEHNIPYEVIVKRGDVVSTIVKTAKELNCDLMVIGFHGETSLTDYIFRSNTMYNLIDRSYCPVMVVK